MASKVPGSALAPSRINLRSIGAAQGSSVIPVVDVRCSYRLPQSMANAANRNVMKLSVPTTHMDRTYQYFDELVYYSNSAVELLENGFNLTDPVAGTWIGQGAVWHEHEVPTDDAIQAVGYQKIDYNTFSPNELSSPRAAGLESIKSRAEMRVRLAPVNQVWIKGNPEAIGQPFVWVSGYNRHQVQAWIHSQNTQDPFLMRSMAELFISGQPINAATLRECGFKIMFEGTIDEIAIFRQPDQSYLQWKPGCTLEEMKSLQISQPDFLQGQFGLEANRTLSYLTVIQDKDAPAEDLTKRVTVSDLRQAGFAPDPDSPEIWIRRTNIYNTDGQRLVHIWIPDKTLGEMRAWYLVNKNTVKPNHLVAPYIPSSSLDRAIYSTDAFHQFTIVPEQPIASRAKSVDVTTSTETLSKLKTYTSIKDTPSTSYRCLRDETHTLLVPKEVVREKVSKTTTTDTSVRSKPASSVSIGISTDSYTTLSKYTSTDKPLMLDKQVQTDEYQEISLRSTATQTDPVVKLKPRKLESPLPFEFLPSARRPSYTPGFKKIDGYYTDSESEPEEFMPKPKLPDYTPGYRIFDGYHSPDESLPLAKRPDYLPGYKIPDGFYSDSEPEKLPTARRPSYPLGHKVPDGYFSDTEPEKLPSARRPSFPAGYKAPAHPDYRMKEDYAMPMDYPGFDSVPESMPKARSLAPTRTKARPTTQRRVPEKASTTKPISEVRVRFTEPKDSTKESAKTDRVKFESDHEGRKKTSSRSGSKQ